MSEFHGIDDDDDAPRRRKAPNKKVDPYWSLWGKLKVRRTQNGRRRGTQVGKKLCLPIRKVALGYEKDAITISGTQKPVTSDHHAVATLKKLDTDDGYYEEIVGQAPPHDAHVLLYDKRTGGVEARAYEVTHPRPICKCGKPCSADPRRAPAA